MHFSLTTYAILAMKLKTLPACLPCVRAEVHGGVPEHRAAPAEVADGQNGCAEGRHLPGSHKSSGPRHGTGKVGVRCRDEDVVLKADEAYPEWKTVQSLHASAVQFSWQGIG